MYTAIYTGIMFLIHVTEVSCKDCLFCFESRHWIHLACDIEIHDQYISTCLFDDR